MPRRFTIIQGGLAERTPAPSSAAPMLAERWRVVLRQARSVEEPEIAAWRALIGRQPLQDPFADPDYLLTAARHGARGCEVVFALIFAEAGSGSDTLAGVVPLVLANPAWGAPIRLWQPPLAPRPVQPVLDAGCATAGLEAVLRHLSERSPGATIRLDGIASAGSLLRALRADGRLRVTTRSASRPIPSLRFVDLRPKQPEAEIERVTAVAGMRDAVERFLLAEAQASFAPLLSDPVDATITRVVTRLFASRGGACIELGRREGAIVGGSIRLGRDSALWRSIGVRTSHGDGEAVENLDLALEPEAGRETRVARLRLIAP